MRDEEGMGMMDGQVGKCVVVRILLPFFKKVLVLI